MSIEFQKSEDYNGFWQRNSRRIMNKNDNFIICIYRSFGRTADDSSI